MFMGLAGFIVIDWVFYCEFVLGIKETVGLGLAGRGYLNTQV